MISNTDILAERQEKVNCMIFHIFQRIIVHLAIWGRVWYHGPRRAVRGLKTKMWVAILAAAFGLCLGLGIWLMAPGRTAQWAEIYSGGVLVKTVDLRIDQEFTVEGGNGVNTVTVRDGKIAVTQADCPDHYCMQRGFCQGGTAIVCLPNRLVIEFVGEQDIDGAVG